MANDSNIIPLLHDALDQHKQAGQYDIPIVALLTPRSTNRCHVLLAWLSKPSSTSSLQVCFRYQCLVRCAHSFVYPRARCISPSPAIRSGPGLATYSIFQLLMVREPSRRSLSGMACRSHWPNLSRMHVARTENHQA